MIKNALSVLLMLTATATNSYADLTDILDPFTTVFKGGDKVISELNKDKEFNKLVVDTFTIEEYAEWLSVKQKFQAKETRQKEQFISCIESGIDKRLCTDPHYCLYPSNEKANICYNSVTK